MAYTMIHTPLSHLTNDELLQQVWNAEEPSWLEVELAQRIVNLQEEIEDLTPEVA